MRSRSPPGSITAPRLLSSSHSKVQFCWNGVTGTIAAFRDIGPRSAAQASALATCAGALGAPQENSSLAAPLRTGGGSRALPARTSTLGAACAHGLASLQAEGQQAWTAHRTLRPLDFASQAE